MTVEIDATLISVSFSIFTKAQDISFLFFSFQKLYLY
jgi:hypothetical protein